MTKARPVGVAVVEVPAALGPLEGGLVPDRLLVRHWMARQEGRQKSVGKSGPLLVAAIVDLLAPQPS